jgi:uncharacterized protein (TIRG00374 family)
VWLVISFDWRAILHEVSGLNWTLVLISLAIFSLWVLPCSIRWRQIARACGYPFDLSLSVRAYYIGSFFNAFLPTGRGGDVVRAWLVARERGYSAAGLLATVFVERLIGFFVALCFVIGTALLTVSGTNALRPALVSAAILAGAIAAAAIIAATPPVRSAVRGLVTRVAGVRLGAAAVEVARVLQATQRSQSLVVAQAAYSALNQLALIVSGFILAQAIAGFEAPWYAFLVVIPLVFVAGVLPSIGGYGVREVSYVVALGWFGVAPEAAALYSLLQLLFLWCMSLIGAFLFAARGLAPAHHKTHQVSEP